MTLSKTCLHFWSLGHWPCRCFLPCPSEYVFESIESIIILSRTQVLLVLLVILVLDVIIWNRVIKHLAYGSLMQVWIYVTLSYILLNLQIPRKRTYLRQLVFYLSTSTWWLDSTFRLNACICPSVHFSDLRSQLFHGYSLHVSVMHSLQNDIGYTCIVLKSRDGTLHPFLIMKFKVSAILLLSAN